MITHPSIYQNLRKCTSKPLSIPVYHLSVRTPPGIKNIVTLKYVDDLTLVEPISASQPSVMQEHLDNFEEWAATNNMKLNPKKCASMKVSFLLNNPQEPPLTISNIPLQEVQVAKILGVNISDDLRWSVHVAEILKKANGRLYMLKLLKRFNLPHDDLVTIFTGFVRPLAEYAAPVWHCGLTVNESIALERIQKRACKIIMGRHYSSYDEALQECGLDSLSDRRDQLSLNFLKSLMESDQFSGWVPPTRSPGGATRMARGGIRLVHGHTKSTLITYFSGMKIDPKYAFLHAFFLICPSCPFQNLSRGDPGELSHVLHFVPFCRDER